MSRLSYQVLLLLLLIIGLGVIALYSGNDYLRVWIIEEDGWVEWLTVASFLLAALLAGARFGQAKHTGGLPAMGFNLLIMLFCLFVVAEELSWFQRIFSNPSGSFFQDYNLQGETNLHNLEVAGLKVNFWLFSFLLENFLAVYFFVFPLLCAQFGKVARWADRISIPIPHFGYSACFGVVYIFVSTNPSGKAWELMELTYGVLLCLLLTDSKSNG